MGLSEELCVLIQWTNSFQSKYLSAFVYFMITHKQLGTQALREGYFHLLNR